MTKCSIDGCGRKLFCKGMCNGHYKRNWRHGSPFHGRRMNGDLKKWIEYHVDHSGHECLIWPFSMKKDGYASTLQIDGKKWDAHRYMCFVKNGPPPSKKHTTAHNCGRGNHGCVHPGHLRWATWAENHADKIKHGTSSRCENHYNATMTDRIVSQIKRLNKKQELKPKQIAEKLNVPPSRVYSIISGRSWRHIK